MSYKPLVLQSIRVRGLGDVVDTPWFTIGKELSYFNLPASFNRKGFLQALQTINPPYLFEHEKPFRDYPNIYRQGKYQKRVRPQRKTITFMVFIAQPQFVKKLAGITPLLYEADRVELGRRMDYSRWVNFVELASSTRWSELQETIEHLANKYPIEEPIHRLGRSLKPTDRIVDDVRDVFTNWLKKILETENSQQGRALLEQTRFTVERQDHFYRAKRCVEQNLPLFFIIDNDLVYCIQSHNSMFSRKKHDRKPAKEEPSLSAECLFLKRHICREDWQEIADEKSCAPKMQDVLTIIRWAVEKIGIICRQKLNTVPVFCFDEPDIGLHGDEKAQLRRFAHDISQEYQSLYMACTDTLPEKARILTLEDLCKPR